MLPLPLFVKVEMNDVYRDSYRWRRFIKQDLHYVALRASHSASVEPGHGEVNARVNSDGDLNAVLNGGIPDDAVSMIRVPHRRTTEEYLRSTGLIATLDRH